MERLLEVTDPRALKARIQDATSLLSVEEMRQLKLESSANWPPRTKPQEGEGYIFFQGPTPKTGTQPDRASFFDDLKTVHPNPNPNPRRTRTLTLKTVPLNLVEPYA